MFICFKVWYFNSTLCTANYTLLTKLVCSCQFFRCHNDKIRQTLIIGIQGI
jgi:hypothetical protein